MTGPNEKTGSVRCLFFDGKNACYAQNVIRGKEGRRLFDGGDYFKYCSLEVEPGGGSADERGGDARRKF